MGPVEQPKTDEQEGIQAPEDDETPELTDPGPHYAKDSSMAAPDGIHHRVKGRPRKDGAVPGSVLPDRPFPIPTPRFREYKSDATDPHRRSKPFLTYWNGLPEWAKGRIECYVYREHPVLLEPPEDPETGKTKYYKYIDKISGSEPLQDELDLLHRYGCGSYKISIQDTSTAKKQGDRGLAYCYIVNIGGADYKSNPPNDQRINDIDQLDMDNPANKSYISFLRGQGKLPDQLNAKQQENEMATVEVVKGMADQNAGMFKEVISMAKERGQGQDAVLNVMADASKRSNEVLADGAKRSNEMVQEAFTRAKSMLDETAAQAQRPTTPSADPVVTALEIVKLIREGNGNGSDARIEALQNQLTQMQQSQLESLREQVKILMEAKVTTPAASTSPFAAMNEGFDALEKFNGVIDRLRGNDKEEAAGNAVVDAVTEAAPKWVTKYLVPLSPILVQIASAWLQSRGQQLQYPPGYIPPPPGFYPPNAPPGLVATQIQPPMPTPMPPRPVPIDNPNNLPPAIVEVLSSIKDSLGFHMHYQMTGTEFASWYISQFGEPRYREIANLGPDQILQALMLYPPTLNVLRVQKEDVVKGFVVEFCNPQWDEEGPEDANSPSPADPVPTPSA